jgi:glycosyltransferase involved in cell wall biosynthesis
MKVLLSAIACHPDLGSEGAVGWKSALAIARRHKVHVLTHVDHENAIQKYIEKTGLTNPSFTYFGEGGPYHENRLIARAQSWFRYFAWMRESLSQARSLMKDESFDLIHHATYSTYRVACPLWRFGLPFVFGPVGGGEKLPWVAAGSMSRGQRAQEAVRMVANALTLFPGKVRQTVRSASVLIASNKPTAEVLRMIGRDKKQPTILPVVFFTARQIQEIRTRVKVYAENGNHLSIFSSGMLEGRKGLSIALHAVRLAIDAGLSIDFTIPSRGPEFSHLKNLAGKLGISCAVKFPDSLPRDEYWDKLLSADVYMAPSLRDNCPATLLEAMLARCVPIVANCNGPGEIVSEATGEVIEPADPDTMAHEIKNRLLTLAANRKVLRQKAEAASNYVANTFTEDRYLSVIESAYTEAISNSPATAKN